VLHSDRVCRAVSGLQTAGFRAGPRAQWKSDDFRQPSIAGTEGTSAIFGGFPRLPCRAVLTMSAYAYQEASSLVLAIDLDQRTRATAARSTSVHPYWFCIWTKRGSGGETGRAAGVLIWRSRKGRGPRWPSCAIAAYVLLPRYGLIAAALRVGEFLRTINPRPRCACVRSQAQPAPRAPRAVPRTPPRPRGPRQVRW
jgi:hypothetical protein